MAIVNGQRLQQDPRTPRVTARVVVKLRAGAPPPGSASIDASGEDVWSGLARRYPGVAVRPYFAEALGPDAAARSIAPPSATPSLDTRRYMAVDVPAGIEADEVAADIRQASNVETAYREGGPTPPPVSPDDDPRSASQGYLNSAPEGVDARWAWREGNVDGSGVGFVDLERGWTLGHEDLSGAGINLISGVNLDYRGHGTAVLGEVAAVDNGLGGIGIAPSAVARVVSQWRTPNTYSTADAILSAANAMEAGDVLLLEAQTTYPTTGSDFVPVEVEDLVFDAIRSAVSRGIVVIEAAANGGVDLDQFQDVRGRRILNRNSADFRDSGAIMVGAATSSHPHQRLGFSCFGSRIDCFAWGENIDTSGDGGIGDDVNVYTSGFGGTSGASPIVTACALLVQSMRVRDGQARLAPSQLRTLLSDPVLNTPSANPSGDLIGVMPNLRAIIENARADEPVNAPSGLAASNQ
jgi:hypothetical protein